MKNTALKAISRGASVRLLIPWLLAAACGLTAAPALADDDDDDSFPEEDRLAQIRAEGTIEIAVYENFPPYSFPKSDGSGHVGIDVDIARAIAERMDLQMKLRAMTPDESMEDDLRNNIWKGHYIGGGVADVMLHVGADPEFAARNAEDVIIFSPYFKETMGIAHGRDSNFKSLLDLTDREVGVQLDTLGDYFLTNAFSGQLRDNVVHFDSVPAAVKGMLDGAVAAVMAPRGELQGAVAAAKATDVEISQTTLSGLYRTDWEVGLAVAAGNDKLKTALADTMDQLEQDGTLEQIFRSYGVEYVRPQGDLEAVTAAED